jgi:hypothetical protein
MDHPVQLKAVVLKLHISSRPAHQSLHQLTGCPTFHVRSWIVTFVLVAVLFRLLFFIS